VCATFTLSQLSRNAQHGMIGFTGVHNYENRDWLTQLPFILINAGRLVLQVWYKPTLFTKSSGKSCAAALWPQPGV
jgi:hypothetical protein